MGWQLWVEKRQRTGAVHDASHGTEAAGVGERPLYCAPSGLCVHILLIPRALPWALLLRPLWARALGYPRFIIAMRSQKSLRRGCGSGRSTRCGSTWGTRGAWSGPELASLWETLHFLPLLWGEKGLYFGLAGIADFHDFLAPLFHGKGLFQLKLLEFLELFFENRLNLCLLLVGKAVHAGPAI